MGLACLWLLLWLRHRPGTFPGLMGEPLSLPGAPSELVAVPVATSDQSVLRYSIRSGGVAVSVLDAMQMLGEDPSAGQLGRLLTATITRCRFESALFFETPPVNAKTAALTDFEFVLVDAPGLAHVNADPGPFAKQISAAGTSAHPSLAVQFHNLGGDALLIAPTLAACHGSSGVDNNQLYCGHLVQFLKHSTAEAGAALWRTVGQAMVEQLQSLEAQEQPDQNVWLSTSGLGVAWLHVRLDSSPKYYQYAPFRGPKPNRRVAQG